MPPARRGSTHLSSENAPSSLAPVQQKAGKNRIQQQGTWTPKNVPARLVFGSCSDAGCSHDGKTKTNQDSFMAAVPHPYGGTALFAVFDGHGEHGHHVSRACVKDFGLLLHQEQARRSDMRSAIVSAYLEQDRMVNSTVDCSQSGTTAVTCFLRADSATGRIMLHTAWAGDSRAVLGCVRPDGSLGAQDLTVDQKPERPDEQARIEKAGGIVEPVKDERNQPAGPPRVWYIAQVAPGLAMSRSIGDAVGAMVGVTAEPEIHERVLQPEDALLVIASDGVWEFLSSQEVISFVSQKLRGQPITEDALAAATSALCEKARTYWLEEDAYVDDITAVVIVLQMARSEPPQGRGGGPQQRASGANGNGRPPLAPSAAAPPNGHGTPTGGGRYGGNDRGGYSTPQQGQPPYAQPPYGQPPQQSPGGAVATPAFNPHSSKSPSVGKSQLRMSVSAIGPSGKRGAVSGESASHLTKPGAKTELRRTRKSPEQMALILNAIKDPRHLIFSQMSEEARVLVAECMVEQQARAGQAVIRQGEQGDIVYIVESGYYEVFLEQLGERPVAGYQSGDSFGELALMYSCARAATVKCVTPGSLWGLERTTYRTIVQQTSDSTNSSVLQMLKTVAVFQPLDAAQLSALANSLQIVTCQSGTPLLRNAPFDAMYILQSGTMSISYGGGPPQHLQPGASVGEASVAGDQNQSGELVTLTATSPCVLARLTREAFSRHVGALQDIKDTHFNEKALASIQELAALTIAERRQLAKLLTRTYYPAGHVIAKPGTEMTQLHIVYRGRVSLQGVSMAPGNGRRPSAAGMTLSEGAVFGEGVLLRNERSAGTYVAEGDCVCMVVSRDKVQQSLGPISAILERESQKALRKQQAMSIAFNNLQLGQIVGIGTFGVVRIAQDSRTNSTFALKSMKKQKVWEMGQVEHITAECKLLSEVDHPFIVNLVRLYEEDHSIHLLIELIQGGELFSVLRAAPAGAFPERRCQFYAAMIVLAFEYLHDKAIIYRDLKPENLLFDADGYLKVVDFGFAKRVQERTWTVCGTPEYMSPEIITNQGHGKAVDWWTLGILIYEMLVGYPPFEGDDPMSLYKNIVKNDIKFPKKVVGPVLDIIKGLLTSDPAERIGNLSGGADDIKKHPWMKKVTWPSLLLKKIEAPYKPTIASATDASNFDAYDDPDANAPPPRQTYPRGTFDEFSKLVRVK